MSEYNKNISVNLPADCIYEIIQYIIYDLKTLHSCITVNKTFCQVSIQILWSNPFKYIEDEDKKKKWLIFRTYFSCLDDQEKKQIMTFIHKPVSDFPKPFINYPRFLQVFGTYNIQSSIRSFLQHYTVSTTENRINNIIYILNPFLEKLFFKDQSNFKYMKVDLNDEKNQMDWSLFNNNIVFSNIIKLSFEFSIKSSIKKMEILKFIQKNLSTFIDIISEYNKDIQHIRLSFMIEKPRLKKLETEYDNLLETLKYFICSLNNLNNLKSLEIPYSLCNEDLNNLLRKNSHSLTYLRLHEISDLLTVLNILEHCSNLKTIELLSFHNNTNIDNSICYKHITSNLDHLKNLYMTVPCIPVLILFQRIVLMANNNNLRTLFYDNIISDNYSRSNILLSCKNITHLFIRMTKKEFSFNISFLKKLKHLVFLKLGWNNYLKIGQIRELALSFPPSLQILEIIDIESQIIIARLTVLFQEMPCYLKEIGIEMHINDTILQIIMDYAKQKNSLITFRYTKSQNHNYNKISEKLLEAAKSLFTVDDNPRPFKISFIESGF
ncbi:hypothetical protein C1645_828524 [Glomus cerebriforme]|uniref:F-box domain-containing protein n=1 Tax=Glomus cerebriforme TaxID=658196 RepID=A0A397SLL8_9GLOM|nr:hypothetical protein C1645_828524 [Glomus cerebriforme]